MSSVFTGAHTYVPAVNICRHIVNVMGYLWERTALDFDCIGIRSGRAGLSPINCCSDYGCWAFPCFRSSRRMESL